MNNFNDLLILLEKIIPSNADVIQIGDEKKLHKKDFNDFLKSNKIFLHGKQYFFYFSNRVFKLKLETEGDILVPMSGSTVKENSVEIDFSYIPTTPKNSEDLFEIFNSGKWIQSKVKHDDSKGFWSILIKALSHYKGAKEEVRFSFFGRKNEVADTIRKKDDDKLKKEIRLNHIPLDIIGYVLKNKDISELNTKIDASLDELLQKIKSDFLYCMGLKEFRGRNKEIDDLLGTVGTLLFNIYANHNPNDEEKENLSKQINPIHVFIVNLSKKLKNSSDVSELKFLEHCKELYDLAFLLKVYLDINTTFKKWSDSNFTKTVTKIKEIFNNINNEHEANIEIYQSFKNDFLNILHKFPELEIDKKIFKKGLIFAINKATADGYFQTQENYLNKLQQFINDFSDTNVVSLIDIKNINLSLSDNYKKAIGNLIKLTEKGQQASLNRREQLYWKKLINDGLKPEYVDGQIYFTVA